MKRLLLVFYLFFSFSVFAQKISIDSLSRVATILQGKERIPVLIQRAEAAMRTRHTKAHEFANEAFVWADSFKNIKEIEKSLSIKAQIALNQNKYALAQSLFIQLLQIEKELGDSIAYGTTLVNIGRTYDQQGDYLPALAHFYSALKVQDSIQDIKGKTSTLSYLGVTLKNQEKYEESLKYHQEAYQNALILNDKKQTSIILNNLGVTFRHLGVFDSALFYHQKALKMDEELQDTYGMSICHNCIGVVYKLMGDPQKALKHYDLGKRLSEKGGNKLGIAISSLDMSEVFLDLKEYDKAYLYALTSLMMAKDISAKRRVKEAALTLSNIEELRGNYQKSLEYYKMYSDYKDSIFNDQSSQQIAELQTKYDSEKREMEISSLQKEKKMQEAENQRQRYIGYGLTVFIFSLFILSFLLLKNNREKLKANRLLTKQKKEIDEKNNILHDTNEELKFTLDLVEKQKYSIEYQNLNIMSSISYAKRIQSAMLPKKEFIQQFLPESFVLFRPKDVVSGDFYWVAETKEGYVIAAADCTGHGVPGAFVSMVGNSFLNEIVIGEGFSTPHVILKRLHNKIIDFFHQKEESNESTISDGMDISICMIDKSKKTVKYAGAMNPLYYLPMNEVNRGEVIEIKGDKQPVGGMQKRERQPFTSHTITISSPTTFYMCSDGYQDQFGGKNNKKFMVKRLKKLLFEIYSKDMNEQKHILQATLEDWMQNEIQIDDILIVGFRI
jgi:serine phosphatase RsbU (regulator of sigma subunit)